MMSIGRTGYLAFAFGRLSNMRKLVGLTVATGLCLALAGCGGSGSGSPARDRWTILVFLNAANDLYEYSDLNVNQMEQVAQNPSVNIVVQWKQSQTTFPQSSFDGTRRYHVRPDATSAIASRLVQDMGKGVDMGRPQTLLQFVEWAKARYPAERYGLIVWNHGNGWRRGADSGRAVSYDDETGHAIQTWEIGEALAGHAFDFVAWDASLMQMMEVAYETRAHANYIVGSEESPPGAGYPYHTILDDFRDRPTDSTLALTKAFVDGMLEWTPYNDSKITQSVVASAGLDDLAAKLDTLGGLLALHAPTLATQIQVARDTSQTYSQTFSRYYRDLIDVLLKLEAQDGVPPEVLAASAAARASAEQAIVWEGHNARSPGSHGLSIDFSPASRFNDFDTDYELLQFGATRWTDFLRVAP
jgi:hypothetical protein